MDQSCGEHDLPSSNLYLSQSIYKCLFSKYKEAVVKTVAESTHDTTLGGVQIADAPKCFIGTAGHQEWVYKKETLAGINVCLEKCRKANGGEILEIYKHYSASSSRSFEIV